MKTYEYFVTEYFNPIVFKGILGREHKEIDRAFKCTPSTLTYIHIILIFVNQLNKINKYLIARKC